MAIEIARVPVLSDNYAWLVNDPLSDRAVVIDPGEAQPVIDAAHDRQWTICEIWLTHWHPDHVGGAAEIAKRTGAKVTGPAAEQDKVPSVAFDTAVAEGDVVRLGDNEATVMEVPGHTAGHIAFHFAEAEAVFTGDTLFAMGCGRLFEGTPEQMFANMQRYSMMPDATRVYCGHEYTQSNGRYALVAEPDNDAIRARMEQVDAARAAGEPTVPTTIGDEKATNPFLRAADAATLGKRRAEKDAFKG